MIGTILYTLIVAPLVLVVQVFYKGIYLLLCAFLNKNLATGLALVGVSLLVSFLTLPMYRKADLIQKKQREKEKAMKPWLDHIRRTFRGDERFFMQQAYYRLCGYSPLSILNMSISLFLQIPFFMAAYRYLSHLDLLQGMSFGPIADLGAPDGLLKIGAASINLLPVLMTLINCVSGSIYTKGFALKEKVQLYGMALIFLVLLYNSPAGLVFYWTCNNLFGLVKNIFYRLRNPRKVFAVGFASTGVLLALVMIFHGEIKSFNRLAFLIALLVLFFAPLALLLKKNRRPEYHPLPESPEEQRRWRTAFFLGGLFLSVLLGLVIPSALIADSPAEFININAYQNPLHFLVHSACYAAGFFLLWSGIVYFMLAPVYRRRLVMVFFFLSLGCLADYLFFGRHLGNISPYLVFDIRPSYSRAELLANLAVIALLAALCFVLLRFKKVQELLPFASAVLVVVALVVSGTNMVNTQRQLNAMAYIKNPAESDGAEVRPLWSLSRNGKNVIVFMLDRAVSGYVPYMLQEKPELQRQFAGFTYYPNTVSFGPYTAFGTCALFGGYEYTVPQMNRRNTERNVDKQNELLRVMPVIFDEAGFEVTVCDPPYAGYQWIPDLSIYDDYPGIRPYITLNKYIEKIEFENIDWHGQTVTDTLKRNERNFFMYSVFKCVPVILQKPVYYYGEYWGDEPISNNFVGSYAVLHLLEKLTRVTESEKGTFLMINNNTPHNPQTLFLPDYSPAPSAQTDPDYQTAQGTGLVCSDENQEQHYQANMATFLQLGKWFDFMRENGVWDNTRIILVADHGIGLGQFDYMKMGDIFLDVQSLNPLFMVKDFNQTSFTTSDEFMTQADTPTLALEGVVENPVNPFTHKPITNEEKFAHPQIVTSHSGTDGGIGQSGDATTFDTVGGHWYAVHDNIFDRANWELLDDSLFEQ